jgi:hypothetical protein
MLIGYARVSTIEPDTTAQLKAAGYDRICRERVAGTTPSYTDSMPWMVRLPAAASKASCRRYHSQPPTPRHPRYGTTTAPSGGASQFREISETSDRLLVACADRIFDLSMMGPGIPWGKNKLRSPRRAFCRIDSSECWGSRFSSNSLIVLFSPSSMRSLMICGSYTRSIDHQRIKQAPELAQMVSVAPVSG